MKDHVCLKVGRRNTHGPEKRMKNRCDTDLSISRSTSSIEGDRKENMNWPPVE